MPQLEALTLWVAVGSYAVATVTVIAGVAFSKTGLVRFAFVCAATGAVAQAGSLLARWGRVGHGPAVGYFEVASGLVFMAVTAYVLLAWRAPALRATGIVFMPFALLALGSTLLVDPAVREVGGALASAWLVLHVLFANLAFASYAAALVFASATLLAGSSAAGRFGAILSHMPSTHAREEYTARFALAGFALQGVMIATGAIWANEAWGRYWGWDPIEVWSLLAWLLMAMHLHAVRTLGWKGKRSAWLVVAAFAALTFSLLGVPAAYDSIHGAYLSLS